FVEALVASHPGFIVRFVGGVCFLSGMLLMAWNTWRTVRVADPKLALDNAQMA
ncbi:cytochrome C oxidase Cbb3, partial [Pseudomonas sp. FBF18]|nr:cytochrome C oxidase Cbb3 [Pseudomonas sp. FBF18]